MRGCLCRPHQAQVARVHAQSLAAVEFDGAAPRLLVDGDAHSLLAIVVFCVDKVIDAHAAPLRKHTRAVVAPRLLAAARGRWRREQLHHFQLLAEHVLLVKELLLDERLLRGRTRTRTGQRSARSSLRHTPRTARTNSRAGRGSEHLLHLFASHLSELLVGGLVIGLVVGVGRGDAGRQRVGPALAAQGHWPFAQRGDAAPGRGADGRRRALPGGARAVHARGTRAPLSGTARSECACGAAAPRSDVPRGRRSLRGRCGAEISGLCGHASEL